ncbi:MULTISPECIES: spore coat protein CotJB [Clostridiaceae]|uniref:spore coat protein CotJB n=1 Tax=Clostridiaceae TaxID=31979 RepID=UPI0005522692|nr:MULTISPECIES: spore coat protein CotJB [Clostridiaceae]
MAKMCYDDNDRSKMMKKIKELEFAAVELNLYLDNHPNNQRALNDYNMTTDMLMDMKEAYEVKYGPLTNFGYAKSTPSWKWVEEPWPWEIGE